MEFASKGTGGVVTWDKMVRIRHSLSGRYLAVNPTPKLIGGASPSDPWFEAMMTENPTDEGMFLMVGITQQRDKDRGRVVLEDCSVRLRHPFRNPVRGLDGQTIDSCWLHFSNIAKASHQPNQPLRWVRVRVGVGVRSFVVRSAVGGRVGVLAWSAGASVVALGGRGAWARYGRFFPGARPPSPPSFCRADSALVLRTSCSNSAPDRRRLR